MDCELVKKMFPYDEWFKMLKNDYDYPFTPYKTRVSGQEKVSKTPILDFVRLALNEVHEIEDGGSAKVVITKGGRTFEVRIRDVTPEPDEKIEVVSVEYENPSEDDEDYESKE